ncbi:tRNA (guanosine(46)-N7)-methyltransferase TrmB [Litorivicinus lipolyticus]|uniref:tRNA (guanine-N(7)-)-methyltransferase n=1 Tax=Litorivicinus lipolyticus TaxID=418701 RepID=A0A5Q2QDY3_9GAMM|nr:tRNA (guanosine(46)-N7)-methyltransferase TrmB [Litorivicinus lipolyticus]QGG79225.1 tRNA (guanosine(46)-N7)-methyltransferase TrmB [Litorivicinus lipolyticus]
MTDNQELSHRRIRSFVVRAGRMTPGQIQALETHWQRYGLDLNGGMIDWPAGPRVLELGFGMGASLLQQAQDAPDSQFVGIEVHPPGVGRLLSQASDADVGNLRVFKDDGIEVLNQCIADASVDRFQLYFPDPWHKKRHNKRRIVQPAFAAQVRAKLKPGGLLHMATDWEPYAEHMLAVMQAAPGYRNTVADFAPKPDWRPVTKFQTRGEKLGHGVWDLIFEAI